MSHAAPRVDGQNVAPVLVLDADQTSSLAVARSLGRHGVVVHAAASVPRPIGGLSRHTRSVALYPDPLTDAIGFIDWVRARMAAEPRLLVFPLTERSLVPLMQHRLALNNANLAMPATEALEQVLDKARTLALAETLGLSVPRSHRLPDHTALGAMDPERLDWGWPIVVKPVRSVGESGGRRVQLAVRYAHNAQELLTIASEVLRFGEVILQEYFPGDGIGIELIADHGRVCHVFQHRRLHEVPLTGGGSSLRVSEPVVTKLRDAATALMAALHWHGVAMVEFKYQPATGAYRLMEINGRFWGSLPLAVAAGADFPAMLHGLMSRGSVTPCPPARHGVVCRQLARDLDWTEHVLRKAAPPQLVQIPTMGAVLRDWALVLSPRHHFDAQSLSDPWPGLVDMARIAKTFAARFSERASATRRLRSEWKASRQRRAAGGTTADVGTQLPSQVLFLCYGNINRSALAESWARRKFRNGTQFVSAGFHAEAGRPADPVMVDVAAACGADLSGWQSKTLDADLVQQSDLILAMEVRHLDQLLQLHPQARGKAFLLGAAAASAPQAAEIPDPYGQPREIYERVCRQVTRSVDAWLSALQLT